MKHIIFILFLFLTSCTNTSFNQLTSNVDVKVEANLNATIKVGEKITFKITSETEFHTFTIDELDLYETADAGESYEFTITFETAGTYRLYCVPHETLGMIGEVIVQ